jgi:ABC-type proline/glycine betaine transport system ATPase subunit
MTDQECLIQQDKILKGVTDAMAKALDRHRRLGESVAILRDGEIVILGPEEIEQLLKEQASSDPI